MMHTSSYTHTHHTHIHNTCAPACRYSKVILQIDLRVLESLSLDSNDIWFIDISRKLMKLSTFSCFWTLDFLPFLSPMLSEASLEAYIFMNSELNHPKPTYSSTLQILFLEKRKELPFTEHLCKIWWAKYGHFCFWRPKFSCKILLGGYFSRQYF